MHLIDTKKIASDIFQEAVRAVDPYELVRDHTEVIRAAYSDGNYKKLLIVGFGKASCPMAAAVEDVLDDVSGIVITKYGHCSKAPKQIRVREAGHPVPDVNGITATGEIMKLLKESGEEPLVVCLISGGGSALLVSPSEGITLAEKQEVTRLLLNAGADIHELNTVRKHLSKVKGGRLAELAYPATVVSLILSDVLGDYLDIIASGPTAPDSSTFGAALGVIEKYRLARAVPAPVIDLLTKGTRGLVPETPKEGNPAFKKVENIIVGNIGKAAEAARKKAETVGCHAEILSTGLTGEARDAGLRLARTALSRKREKSQDIPLCLISGGETTVTVKGSGSGGRNMELALSFASQIDGVDGITLLSAGTDGNDGPTDAAGAIVDGDTVRNARAMGFDSDNYLAGNDSYTFFKRASGLFVTGPTGTNVMDLQIVIIE